MKNRNRLISHLRTSFFLVFCSLACAVLPSCTTHITNFSTRASVETGQGVAIAGFIITGTQSTQVVIRGLGPTLTQDGLSGALADPFLSLFDGHGNVLWNNNNWKDSQQAAIQATGLEPTNDLESAIVRTLAPGKYTAILSGKNGTTGIGLVEVYHLIANRFPLPAQLTNASTRGFVGTGQAVMIGGFIAGGGHTDIQVLVRGLGPSLTQHGVSDALADPVVRLFDGNGNLLRSNNNWKDSQQAGIQATGLAPPNNLESAILQELAPGNYTAILSGRNNTTGIGLVEIYRL
jgi:hypothetical protein